MGARPTSRIPGKIFSFTAGKRSQRLLYGGARQRVILLAGLLTNLGVLFYCAETGLEASSVDLGRAGMASVFEDPRSADSILLTLSLGGKAGGDGPPEGSVRQGRLAGRIDPSSMSTASVFTLLGAHERKFDALLMFPFWQRIKPGSLSRGGKSSSVPHALGPNCKF